MKIGVKARTEFLKSLSKGSVVTLSNGKMAIKEYDSIDCMVVLLNGIKTPILYSLLTCEEIHKAQRVIERLNK